MTEEIKSRVIVTEETEASAPDEQKNKELMDAFRQL